MGALLRKLWGCHLAPEMKIANKIQLQFKLPAITTMFKSWIATLCYFIVYLCYFSTFNFCWWSKHGRLCGEALLLSSGKLLSTAPPPNVGRTYDDLNSEGLPCKAWPRSGERRIQISKALEEARNMELQEQARLLHGDSSCCAISSIATATCSLPAFFKFCLAKDSHYSPLFFPVFLLLLLNIVKLYFQTCIARLDSLWAPCSSARQSYTARYCTLERNSGLCKSSL